MKRLTTLLLAILMCACVSAKESKWVEQQCVDLPSGVKMEKGTTSSGNVKYWFEFDQIGKVTVSPSSAEKYLAGEITLQLVKWRHVDTGEYKYSIRQKKGSKQTKNIDLLTIFKR